MKVNTKALFLTVAGVAFSVPAPTTNQTAEIGKFDRNSYLTECNLAGYDEVYDMERHKTMMRHCLSIYTRGK
jgi:hypothetical protein